MHFASEIDTADWEQQLVYKQIITQNYSLASFHQFNVQRFFFKMFQLHLFLPSNELKRWHMFEWMYDRNLFRGYFATQ